MGLISCKHDRSEIREMNNKINPVKRLCYLLDLAPKYCETYFASFDIYITSQR